MKKLYLFRGVDGAGKTDVASSLNINVVYSADDYFWKGRKYKFVQSENAIAHRECKAKTEDAMKQNIESIGVTNPFATDKELKSYYLMAREHGYKVYSLIVENRHKGKNPNVEKAVTDRQRDRFEVML